MIIKPVLAENNNFITIYFKTFVVKSSGEFVRYGDDVFLFKIVNCCKSFSKFTRILEV